MFYDLIENWLVQKIKIWKVSLKVKIHTPQEKPTLENYMISSDDQQMLNHHDKKHHQKLMKNLKI